MAENKKPSSPRWSYACCYCLVLASFCSHAFTLDRYPWPNEDEPFYYYPAIRALAGQGLNYRMHAEAPHGDTTWAYHAPFFPRVQVAAFWLLGESQFACRILPYLAAHLAILVLCQFLLRAGFFRSAVLLTLVWAGDHAHYRILFGRMEGIGLLCLAIGFVALVRAVTKASLSASFLAGLFLGIAVGFHPVTVSIPLGACLLVPVLSPRRRLLGFFSLAAGGLVAIGLILACWLPSPAASLEQFLWTMRYANGKYAGSTGHLSIWEGVIHAPEAWRYWVLGLSLATLLLIPLAIIRYRSVEVSTEDELPRKAFLLASSFSILSLLGIVALIAPPIPTYYSVYFSVWPVIAFAIHAESGWLKGSYRLAYLALGAVLFACWLPGLRYNAYHVRESVKNYAQLDPSRVAAPLADAVPTGASVTGSPELFFVARQAGINFTPLPWYRASCAVPPDTYVLLLSPDLIRSQPPIDPANMAARATLLKGSLAPGTTLSWSDCVLFGPMKQELGSRVPPPNAITHESVIRP